ncbi:hypothetical protein HKX42_03940 [Salinisphaera sp. USBA-960]|uniref:hypothetical protein n=1 Tax=Salinisphaera orenii TaxID=856731 RepID=UPI001476687E|nr:hypothetical protein [Salifodinibacter halophilus]NNC26026.1 hypothetical protein [Salifodinibacter halophilus]
MTDIADQIELNEVLEAIFYTSCTAITTGATSCFESLASADLATFSTTGKQEAIR